MFLFKYTAFSQFKSLIFPPVKFLNQNPILRNFFSRSYPLLKRKGGASALIDKKPPYKRKKKKQDSSGKGHQSGIYRSHAGKKYKEPRMTPQAKALIDATLDPKMDDYFESMFEDLAAPYDPVVGDPRLSTTNPDELLSLIKNGKKKPTIKNLELLIRVFGWQGRFEDAANVQSLLNQFGVVPDIFIFNAWAWVAAKKKDPEQVQIVMKKMADMGIAPSIQTYTTLISAFVNAGSLEDAFDVANALKVEELGWDLAVYTTLIAGCVRHRELNKAWNLWFDMKIEAVYPDLLTYTAMAAACGVTGQCERALNLLDEMDIDGLHPNTAFFNNVLRSFGTSRALHHPSYLNWVDETVARMTGKRLKRNQRTYQELLVIWAKAGQKHRFDQVLAELRGEGWDIEPRTYSSILTGYGYLNSANSKGGFQTYQLQSGDETKGKVNVSNDSRKWLADQDVEQLMLDGPNRANYEAELFSEDESEDVNTSDSEGEEVEEYTDKEEDKKVEVIQKPKGGWGRAAAAAKLHGDMPFNDPRLNRFVKLLEDDEGDSADIDALLDGKDDTYKQKAPEFMQKPFTSTHIHYEKSKVALAEQDYAPNTGKYTEKMDIQNRSLKEATSNSKNVTFSNKAEETENSEEQENSEMEEEDDDDDEEENEDGWTVPEKDMFSEFKREEIAKEMQHRQGTGFVNLHATHSERQTQNLLEAEQIFFSEVLEEQNLRPDTKMLNSMLAVYAEALRLNRAEQFFKSYETYARVPDVNTHRQMVRMFVRAKRFEKAEEVISQMTNQGLMPDKKCLGMLMDGYAKNGKLEKSLKTLDLMHEFGIVPTQYHVYHLRRTCKKKNITHIGMPKDPREWFWHGLTKLRSSKKKRDLRDVVKIKGALLNKGAQLY